MNLLARLFGHKTPNRVPSGIFTTLAGIPISRLRDYESYLLAGSRKVWASWKCCDLTSTQVSGTKFSLTRQGSTKPVTVNGLSDLLVYPNELQTFPELVYLTCMHIKQSGNGYWFKAASVNGDRPLAVFPLNPSRIEIVPARDMGHIQGYFYRVNGARVPLDVEDVIHFKRPHPNNDYFGLGDLESGEDLFNEHINRETWRKQFWRNGAAPTRIMILDTEMGATPSEEEWRKVKQNWEREYGGVDNAGKTAWLAGKWKQETVGLTAAEMQHIESSKWNVEQICMQHGVPLSVIGVERSANFATADIDNQRFKEYTILPLVRLIEDTANTDLVAGFGAGLQLRWTVSGLINLGKAMLDLVPAIQNGVISINEAREGVGLERDDNNPLWNQHFVLNTLVPLELAGIVADQPQVDQQINDTIKRSIQAALATKQLT